jgi:hypothetical protein
MVLFPIRLDEAVMKASHAWAADIRRKRHIGDFSQWQDHSSYQKACQRLLRDLQGAKGEEVKISQPIIGSFSPFVSYVLTQEMLSQKLC